MKLRNKIGCARAAQLASTARSVLVCSCVCMLRRSLSSGLCKVRIGATGRGGFANRSAMATAASSGHSQQQPITDLIGSNLVLDPRTEKVRSGGGFYLSSHDTVLHTTPFYTRYTVLHTTPFYTHHTVLHTLHCDCPVNRG